MTLQVSIQRLSQVEPHKTVKILSIEGGIGMQDKLRQLGLLPGDTAYIVRHAPFGGPVLIEVGGREIALGQQIAFNILVNET
jgi:Fe2+ transport system protein FeoA